jgi:hypothetical protein
VLHVLFVVLIRALFFFNLLFMLKMSSSSLKRKKEIRGLLVSTRKDKRGDICAEKSSILSREVLASVSPEISSRQREGRKTYKTTLSSSP